MQIETSRTVAAAALAAGLLAGCGSARDASESNFARVIDAHYARGCIAVRPTGGLGVSDGEFPVVVELEEGDRPAVQERNHRNTAQFEAFADAGLLSAEDTTVEGRRGLFSRETVQRPARVYSLTPAGEAALADGADGRSAGRGGFCAGRYAVDEIKRFTEPGTMGPYTVSEVAYVYSPRDVPDWAEALRGNEAVPQVGRALQAKQEGKAALVLTNEGWVHERDFDR